MSRNFKKLTLQYAYLQLEKEEVVEICEKVEPQIKKFLKENYPEHYDAFFGNLEPEIPNSNKVAEKNPIDETPDIDEDCEATKTPKNNDLKKLYRKCACCCI